MLRDGGGGLPGRIKDGGLWVKGKACANAVGVYNDITITLLTAEVLLCPIPQLLKFCS